MKQLQFSTRAAALLLALVMVLTFAACGQRGSESSSSEPSASSEPSSPSQSSVPEFVNPLGDVDLSAISEPVTPSEDLLTKINDAYNVNNDVIGWLSIPDTNVDDPILYHPTDNLYYERRNLSGGYDWYGCYWADYECVFGDRNSISQNTIIYGHSMDDNPEGLKFSQLKKFLDIDFAKNHPYLYFSTPEDDMTWKIFFVGYVDTKLAYNYPEMKTEDYQALLDELDARNQYEYDVDVNTSDKILLLSTCTYPTGYSNPTIDEATKFLVVARLVRPGEATPDTVEITANPNPKKPNNGLN